MTWNEPPLPHPERDPNEPAARNCAFAAGAGGLAVVLLLLLAHVSLGYAVVGGLVSAWVFGWGVGYATQEFMVAYRGYVWSYP